MTVARVTEVISFSEKSFDDAVTQGIARASETLSGVKGAWVKDQSIDIEDGKIVGYKVVLKITFVLR